MLTNLSFEDLIEPVIDIAIKAGREILSIKRAKGLNTSYKSDKSPVTEADKAANQIIIDGLKSITPSVGIISEESLDIVPDDRLTQKYVWMVDPLDGTKEFIDGRPDFTVNIALIEDGRPVLGVVYAPERELLYWGVSSVGAWRRKLDGAPEKIIAGNGQHTKPIITVSHSHQNFETRNFLKQFDDHEEITIGSSLKLCYVADGTADIYPRLGPQHEWDVAAGDAVVRAAGGKVLEQKTKRLLVYNNKKDLKTPHYIAGTNNFGEFDK